MLSPCPLPRLAPQGAIEFLLTAAPTPELLRFIGNAINVYLWRVSTASPHKLAQFGLRPVVSGMAAESALDRVANVDFTPAYLYALIAEDEEVAVLALRAVHFYAHRYAAMDVRGVRREVGRLAQQVQAAAQTLAGIFDAIPRQE